MPTVVVDMQVQTGRGQRSMTQIVTYEPEINLFIRHMRTRAVTQPVEIRELERQQAHEAAACQALEAQVKRLSEEVFARERDLDKVRDTFSRDLEKLRETADRAEERLRASEKRALLEIDRERGAVIKAQKELAETAKRAEKRDAEHRRTVEALQEQQGDARQQTGVLQGKLAALEEAYKSLQEQLKSLRGTTRSPPRRALAAETGPPVRRAARKAAGGKTARAKART
jgi:chromosome segregation ATPase